MKHDKISLLERAAEIYDFGAALRARAPVPAVPVEDIPPSPPAAPEPVVSVPAPPVRPPVGSPGRRARRRIEIDRRMLANRGYVVPEGPVTGLAEEFRLVKRQLLADLERQSGLPDEKRRSVLIASAQPREGKSFCALNLALSLAGEQELEVLLVDGDFAKPDLPALLDFEAGPGLVDALIDSRADVESFVLETDVPRLSILPAGQKVNNIPELLASERAREILSSLAANDRRRIILFDSPPVLAASPASLLAAAVGFTLVVVRADQTTEADLRETISLLSGCDHVGLLLNGAAFAVSGRKYGFYDGYGHAD